jgi:hypothetical protein
VNRGGWRSSEGVDGVSVARVPEGGGEVVEKLLRGDVVLTRCSAGARRGRINRSTTKPSGGGARVRRRCGPVVLVLRSEFGWVGEYQRTTGMLFVLGIEDGEWR